MTLQILCHGPNAMSLTICEAAYGGAGPHSNEAVTLIEGEGIMNEISAFVN